MTNERRCHDVYIATLVPMGSSPRVTGEVTFAHSKYYNVTIPIHHMDRPFVSMS